MIQSSYVKMALPFWCEMKGKCILNAVTFTGLQLDFFAPCPKSQRREGQILAIFLFLIPGLLQNLLQLLYDTTLVIMTGWVCI